MRGRIPPLAAVAATLVVTLAGHAHAQRVIDSVDVGGTYVGGLAYNSQADVVYGTSEHGGSFFAIACSSNTLAAQVSMCSPHRVAYDAIDNKAYCSTGPNGAESVLVVDGATHARIKGIPLAEAWRVLWNPDNNRVYVTQGDENRVAVLDCTTDSVLTRIHVGQYPSRLVLNRPHHKLYVLNNDNNSVSIVDLDSNQLIRTISVGWPPTCGWYSEARDRFYCGAEGVAVIDGIGDTVVDVISDADMAVAMSGNDATGRLMVAKATGSADSVLTVDMNTNTVVARLSGGREPCDVVWSSAADQAYCANSVSGTVTVIAGDGSSILTTLRVSGWPAELLSVPARRRLYVAHASSRYVYVISDSASGIAEPTSPPGGEGEGEVVCVSPTPFRRQTVVECSPHAGSRARVDVVSPLGSVVRSYASAAAGDVRFVWNGTDQSGSSVPAGVYSVLVLFDGRIAGRCRVVKLD